jgi:hypothetical protein
MAHWRSTSLFKKLGVLLLLMCVIGLFWIAVGSVAPAKLEAAPAATEIWSNITTDTTWGLAGSPYMLKISDVWVQSPATLTIEPGVTVYLEEGGRLHIANGATIIAKGTPTQSIVFDRVTPTYTWKNIRHYAGSTSYYRYVQFLYGGNTEGSLYYEGGNHIVNNCQIKGNKRQGIVADGSTVDLRIAGTLFELNKLNSIWTASGAQINISGSTFDDLDGSWSVFVRDYPPAPTITIRNSNFLRDKGVYNEQYKTYTVDAQSNYWAPGIDMGLGVNAGSPLPSQVALVGITTPPNVSSTVSPDPSVAQPPGTVYTFDASGTSDDEDYNSSLQFCWDWEDDGGGCDNTAMVATHSYATGGWHTARLTVTDTDALTGTVTHNILAGYPPTATFTITQNTWSEIEVDASASDDYEDDPADLQARWDWEGDGVWDTGVFSVTDVLTHEYASLGRYWPTLAVVDTDGITSTLSKPVDIIPPAKAAIISGGGGTLVSEDGTVQVDLYTDTVDSDLISAGVVVTHTPWLTVPYGGLPGDFVYTGFNLAAESGGLPLDGVTGTYTITVSYDLDYMTDVLGLPSFEDQIKLYHWSGSSWVPVSFTLDTGKDQLVATVEPFGDFALVMDVTRVYLPLVLQSY